MSRFDAPIVCAAAAAAALGAGFPTGADTLVTVGLGDILDVFLAGSPKSSYTIGSTGRLIPAPGSGAGILIPKPGGGGKGAKGAVHCWLGAVCPNIGKVQDVTSGALVTIGGG